MKCKFCDGTGTTNWCVNGTFVDCPYCGGTGEMEGNMTNEEWLKSLDTEGLVDHLYEVHKGGASVERQAWIEKHKERIKMQIRGWLKEKHNE